MRFGEAPANPKACSEIAKVDPAFCDTFHVGGTRRSPHSSSSQAAARGLGDARGDTCTCYDAWRQAWAQVRADRLLLGHVPHVAEHVAERVRVGGVDAAVRVPTTQPRPEMRGSTAGRSPTVVSPIISTVNSLSISDVAMKRLPTAAWPRAAMQREARRVAGAARRTIDPTAEHRRAAQRAVRRDRRRRSASRRR